MSRTRIAVLGTYSSGSTAVAECLHHLGVCMGRRFFGTFFEPLWLSEHLRKWWSEPHLTERVSRITRVHLLLEWIEDLERDAAVPVGAKHPLLSLCGSELVEAWGPDTRFVWTHRPLENATRSLAKRGWWKRPEVIQQRLWDAVNAFFATQECLRIDFAAMMADPGTEVARLVGYLGLSPSPDQVAAAVASVRPTSRE